MGAILATIGLVIIMVAIVVIAGFAFGIIFLVPPQLFTVFLVAVAGIGLMITGALVGS